MRIPILTRAPRTPAPGHRTYLNDTMIHHRSNPQLLNSVLRAREYRGLNVRFS